MYSGAGIGAVAWMEKDPTIVKFQVAVNRELSRRGYKLIGTDGQLGPATCGAWSWLGSLSDASWQDNPDLAILAGILGDNYALCKAFSNPVKVGSTTPWQPTQITQTNDSPPYLWGTPDPRVTDLQNQINQQLDAMGYNKILVSGKIDAATCGAMKFSADTWGAAFPPQFSLNCQDYLMPTKRAVVVAKPSPVPGPGGGGGAAIPRKAGVSQAWMVGGFIGAAALTGLYAASKKKGRS